MEHMKEIATPISQVLEQNDAVEAAAEAKGDDLEDSPPRPLKGSIPHAPPHEAISSSVPRALTASSESILERVSNAAGADVLAVNDEGLKNVMMSWYYAGYYTGLLEGKQQGHAAAMQQRSS